VLRQKNKQTKAQVPQRGFKEAQVLVVVKKGQNERKKTYFHKTKTRRHSFRTMNNPTIKNNAGSFLEHRSLRLFSLPLFISFLTAYTSRDEALPALLSES